MAAKKGHIDPATARLSVAAVDNSSN